MGNIQRLSIALSLALVIILCGCPKPDYEGTSLIPGPLEKGYDAALEKKADRGIRLKQLGSAMCLHNRVSDKHRT